MLDHPLDTLKLEWPIIMGAPWLVAIMCSAVAIGVWWVTTQFSKDQIAGLNERLAGKDDRIRFAEEQTTVQKGLVEAATAKLIELTTQQQRGATPQQIALTTASLTQDFARVTTSNAGIHLTLNDPDFFKLSPEELMRLLGGPAESTGNGL